MRCVNSQGFVTPTSPWNDSTAAFLLDGRTKELRRRGLSVLEAEIRKNRETLIENSKRTAVREGGSKDALSPLCLDTHKDVGGEGIQ